MDLRFSLALAPDVRDGGGYRRIIAQEPSREGAEWPNPARLGIGNPLIQGRLLLPFADQREESLAERVGGCHLGRCTQELAIGFLPRFKVSRVGQPQTPDLADGERPFLFLRSVIDGLCRGSPKTPHHPAILAQHRQKPRDRAR